MPTVRCPACGTINPNGRRRLVRCRRCHEPLGKCRYCRYYDTRIADCTHMSRAADEHLSDADAVLNCPYFSTTLAVAPAARSGRRLGRVVLVAVPLGLVAVFGTVKLLAPREKALPPTSLKLSVIAPESTSESEGFSLRVLVRNEADRPARDVRCQIAGRSMSHLALEQADPPEVLVEASGQSVTIALGDLAPGEIAGADLYFSIKRLGELRLVVAATADNVQAPARAAVVGEALP